MKGAVVVRHVVDATPPQIGARKVFHGNVVLEVFEHGEKIGSDPLSAPVGFKVVARREEDGRETPRADAWKDELVDAVMSRDEDKIGLWNSGDTVQWLSLRNWLGKEEARSRSSWQVCIDGKVVIADADLQALLERLTTVAVIGGIPVGPDVLLWMGWALRHISRPTMETSVTWPDFPGTR